jgi:hypothetical protein
MAFKINIDAQHFGFRNQLYRFNNSQTNASKVEAGQMLIVVKKVDTSCYPPLFSCTPAAVDPMSMTAINFGARYVCELDTGRDDDLVMV